ncbi:MAG: FUN14 domain-containing protein [Candidatus Nitrosopolaris sp.]
MPVEDFIFSAGGGFMLGAVTGYAIKKVMKIAAVVIGLFVAGLAYLSYRGWVDVKWAAMEDASRSTLTDAFEQVVHAFNNTAIQFESSHQSTVAASGCLTSNSYGWICTRTNDGIQEGLEDWVEMKGGWFA